MAEASKASKSDKTQVSTKEPIVQEDYSEMAAKTVANIRRLQENVMSVNVISPPTSGSNVVSPKSPSGLPPNNPNPESEDGVNVVTIACSGPSSPSGVETPLSPENCFSGTSPPLEKSFPVITADLTTSFNALVTIDPQWQSSKFNVRDRNAVMFNNALMADVWFSVGSEALSQQISQQDHLKPTTTATTAAMPKKIPAHKYVLATASTVFYAMFYGGLANRDLKDPIEVPDVEPEAFLSMLKYIYCDEIDLNPDNVLATLYAAKKYIVPYLANACVSYLESSLSAKNACLLLSQSRLFEEPGLMQRSWEVIDAQAEMALSSEGFTEIDEQTMRLVLERETLNCRETVVFKAAVSWAEAECSRKGITFENDEEKPTKCREVLDTALFLIRFPALTVQEFADTVATSGILTLQETTDLFLYFTAKQKPSIGDFETKPRIGLARQICRRFASSHYRSNQWRYRGRTDSIQFSVDRRIFIVGFGLYGSSNGSSDYSANIQLKSSPGMTPFGRSRIIAENSVKFFSDGSSSTFKVYFKQPVQIEPEIYYTASAILDGAELSYFGQEGYSEVTVGKVSFNFQSSCESTNGTGVQGGQIPELLFYGPSPSQSRDEKVVETLSEPLNVVEIIEEGNAVCQGLESYCQPCE